MRLNITASNLMMVLWIMYPPLTQPELVVLHIKNPCLVGPHATAAAGGHGGACGTEISFFAAQQI
jgi:hypothetical protein